jgi:hypothetical protein
MRYISKGEQMRDMILIRLLTFYMIFVFSPGTLVSTSNKTDRHDIAEILLKVVLNTLTLYKLDVSSE